MALADCYPQRARAELFAQDAGLSLAQIDFSGAPIEFWQRILEEAERKGRVDALLELACEQAPARQDLADLRDEYARRATARPASETVSPPAVVPSPKAPPTECDVVIRHAGEHNEAIARPLAETGRQHSRPTADTTPYESEQARASRDERKRFEMLSESQRIVELKGSVSAALEEANFALLPQAEWFRQQLSSGDRVPCTTYWKTDGVAVLLLSVVRISSSLTESDLRQLSWHDVFGPRIMSATEVAATARNSLGREPSVVRRVAMLVSIKAFRPERVTKVFPLVNRSDAGNSYYGCFIEYPAIIYERHRAGYRIRATQELLVVDSVKTVTDLTLRLKEALNSMETDSVPARDTIAP